MWLLLVFLLALSCQKVEKKQNSEIYTKELFKLRGCTNCHDTKRPLVGPSFEDIAQRYGGEENKEVLVKSIMEGSCNKWGVRYRCMPPQRVEKEEAERMVDWILHLKTTKPPISSS
ncbi:MAG: c-type cytochrome [Hydrogenobacter sp.]